MTHQDRGPARSLSRPLSIDTMASPSGSLLAWSGPNRVDRDDLVQIARVFAALPVPDRAEVFHLAGSRVLTRLGGGSFGRPEDVLSGRGVRLQFRV